MGWSVEVVESRLFAGVVADELVASIQDCESEGDYCHVALAGGNTPAETYRLLSHPPRVGEVDWKRLRFFLGDERWVPPTDAQSNLKMIQETLFARLPAGSLIYPVDTTLPSPDEAARKYESTIRETVPANDAGIPSFEVLLLGVGEDGHIGSIFPGSPLFNEHESLCSSVIQPYDKLPRVTFTPRLILAAGRVIVLARGKAKADIVRQVIEGDASPEKIPARLLFSHPGTVSWFIDSEAGQQLSRK